MKKRRKPNKQQHLPKVGTSPSHDSAAHEQHLEREAIGDVMGIGNAPGWVRWGCLFIGAIILIGGVVTLIALD